MEISSLKNITKNFALFDTAICSASGIRLFPRIEFQIHVHDVKPSEEREIPKGIHR